MKLPIRINKKKISAFCRKNHIVSLALFGSILTSHFRASSDVDILVQFEKNHTPGFFKFIDMESELSTIIGRPVDLKTPKALSRFFRDEVVAQAKVIYLDA